MDFVLLFFIFLLSSQQVRLTYQQNSTMFLLDHASKRGGVKTSSRQLHCARRCAHVSCCVRFVTARKQSCRTLGADYENSVEPTSDTYYTVYNRVSKLVLFSTFYSVVQSDANKMLRGSEIEESSY